jgi:lysophospholipase L1-like esterase
MAAAADFYQVRGGIPNSQYYFQANIVGNQYLFFIGNSVLAGTGLKDANLRYSAQMVKGFKKHFPEATIIETRHTQPGGSWFGLFRCSRGQAVFGEVICSGHLAILDFAAADRNADMELVKTSLEGLVRQVVLYRATHSQILVYTLTPEMLQAYRDGKTPEYIQVSERIAQHYGIPSLNLARYAAEKIIAGEMSFAAFSADGVNPTDAGARIYAAAVAEFIDALLAACPLPDKPQRRTLPPPLFPETDDNGRIVAYEDQPVQRSGRWQPGQASPIGPFRHLLVSNEVGATLTLKFRGSEIGLLDVVDKDSADYEYAIDGAAFRKLAAPQDASGPAMRPVSLAKKLDRKAEHELVLKVASPGTARMGGFLLNGSVADAFAGMSTIERIDAIYAAMDPIVYRPPASRFANIPKTMSKLRDGGELRMVLLGDSIMGNTSASSFELLLMRRYPKCKIVKIASLRSSTGCKYYREDHRVQEYVLKHNPDLLVIGGISNGGDAEAVRSVIQQVRAQKPDTEVLLLTPVFGAMRDEHIRTFTREIDTTTSNFRFNMQKVAAEEKCAFFDMTGPWWAYIQDSGKTYGWFMGDAVHANARGCQIIGRLLEIWFQEQRSATDCIIPPAVVTSIAFVHLPRPQLVSGERPCPTQTLPCPAERSSAAPRPWPHRP